jgi:hypothetical protein
MRLYGKASSTSASQRRLGHHLCPASPARNDEDIMRAMDNKGYEDKPLEEAVFAPVVAATAGPAQGGVPGPPASPFVAGAAPCAGAAPGVGSGGHAAGQATYGPSGSYNGGRGRGSGRARRPKEELQCHFCK